MADCAVCMAFSHTLPALCLQTAAATSTVAKAMGSATKYAVCMFSWIFFILPTVAHQQQLNVMYELFLNN